MITTAWITIAAFGLFWAAINAIASQICVMPRAAANRQSLSMRLATEFTRDRPAIQ
jgi:hypothetical protein